MQGGGGLLLQVDACGVGRACDVGPEMVTRTGSSPPRKLCADTLAFGEEGLLLQVADLLSVHSAPVQLCYRGEHL